MFKDFLHYFVFLYFIIYVALLEELRSEEFHCHFYPVAYVHMTVKPLNLEFELSRPHQHLRASTFILVEHNILTFVCVFNYFLIILLLEVSQHSTTSCSLVSEPMGSLHRI